MKRGLFLITLLLLISAIDAYAAKIEPGKVELDFAPNFRTIIPFTVTGYEQPQIQVGCPEYLTYNDDMKKADDSVMFSVTISLPDKKLESGPSSCGVMVSETIPQGEGMIKTKINLIAQVVIKSPYRGKYAQIGLVTNNANKGEPIEFVVKAENLGDSLIQEAMASIEIKNQNGDTISTVFTDAKDISPGDGVLLKKAIDTTDYRAGRYTAKAKLGYGGGVATDEKGFIVGTYEVSILSYPKEIEISDKQPFTIDIESLWGKPLENVYTATTITNSSNTEVAEIRTAFTSLAPWEITSLSGEIDTTRFRPGEYSIKVNLYYGDKIATQEGKILFKKKAAPKISIAERTKMIVTNQKFITGVIAAIIALDILWLLTKRKHRQAVKKAH